LCSFADVQEHLPFKIQDIVAGTENGCNCEAVGDRVSPPKDGTFMVLRPALLTHVSCFLVVKKRRDSPPAEKED
jgi:hypothetical protein